MSLPAGRGRQAVLAFALALAWYGFYADAGISLSDEGFVVNSGLRVMRGELPGRDFPDPISFVSQLTALTFRLFGADLLAFRALMAALKALTATLVFWMGARLMNGRWALLPYAATLFLSGPIFKAHTPLVFALVACALVEHQLRRDRFSAGLLGGALGAGALLRPEVAFTLILPLTGLALLVDRGRSAEAAAGARGAALAAGLAAAGIGMAVALAMASPFDGWFLQYWDRYLTPVGAAIMDFERMARTLDRDVLGSVVLALRDTFVNLEGGFLGTPLVSWPPSGPFDLLAVAAIAGPIGLSLGLVVSWTAGRSGLLAVTLASLAKYLGRSDVSHLAQHVPMLALAFSVAAFDAARAAGSRPARSALAPLAPLLACALVTAAAWGAIATSDVYTGGIGVLRTAARRLAIPAARVRVDAPLADSLEGLAGAVAARAKSGRRLAAIPNCPLLYLLLGQDSPPSLTYGRRFGEECPPRGNTAARAEAFRALLEARPGALIVIHKEPAPGMETEPSTRCFQQFLDDLTRGLPVNWESDAFQIRQTR